MNLKIESSNAVDVFKEKGCKLVFSALDSSVATEIEYLFASNGLPVFSNAR